MDAQWRNRLAGAKKRASERRVNRFPDAHYAGGSAVLERGNKTNRGILWRTIVLRHYTYAYVHVYEWLGTAPINARDNGTKVYHYLVRR